MGSKLNIFVIYTSKDKKMILPVLDHLKSLEQDHNLNIWHDDPILEGQQWKPQLASRLQETDIFILPLSATFMYSEFVKQLEFKMLIDSYKARESIVIPILLNDCPWDTEFLSEDYKFNFNELEVLPEQRKPIMKWDSDVEAYNNIAASIDKIISNKTGILVQPEVQEVEEMELTNSDTKDQITISFNEEKQTNEPKEVKEIEVERKAEEERKLLKEAEVKRIATEDEERKVDAEAKEKREEERLKVAAETNSVESERRLRAETENRRKAEKERIRIEEEKARKSTKIEAAKHKEEEHQRKWAVKPNDKVEKGPQGEKTGINKKILIASCLALLAIIGIWALSDANSNPEKPIPVKSTTPETDMSKSIPSEEVKIDSGQKEASVPKLAVGDQFESGMIFSLDSTNKNGKIVHIDDAGPMPWQSAIKIHEQLGDGWRLPTLEELQLMRKTVGQEASNSAEFSNGLYWSATAFSEHQARLLRFRDGNTSYHYNRNVETRTYRVRAVRDISW